MSDEQIEKEMQKQYPKLTGAYTAASQYLKDNPNASQSELDSFLRNAYGKDAAGVSKEIFEDIGCYKFETQIWGALKEKFGVSDLNQDLKYAISTLGNKSFTKYVNNHYNLGTENNSIQGEYRSAKTLYEELNNYYKGNLGQIASNKYSKYGEKILESYLTLLGGFKQKKNQAFLDLYDASEDVYGDGYTLINNMYKIILNLTNHGWEIAKNPKTGEVIASEIDVYENKETNQMMYDIFTNFNKGSGDNAEVGLLHQVLKFSSIKRGPKGIRKHLNQESINIGQNFLNQKFSDILKKDGNNILEVYKLITKADRLENGFEKSSKYNEEENNKYQFEKINTQKSGVELFWDGVNIADQFTTIVEQGKTLGGLAGKMAKTLLKIGPIKNLIMNGVQSILDGLKITKDKKLTAQELLAIFYRVAAQMYNVIAGSMYGTAIGSASTGAGLVTSGLFAITGFLAQGVSIELNNIADCLFDGTIKTSWYDKVIFNSNN